MHQQQGANKSRPNLILKMLVKVGCTNSPNHTLSKLLGNLVNY